MAQTKGAAGKATSRRPLEMRRSAEAETHFQYNGTSARLQRRSALLVLGDMAVRGADEAPSRLSRQALREAAAAIFEAVSIEEREALQ